MQVEQILASELTLGQKLNNSVKLGNRANFDLLLSMLSPDVCEQSQFHLASQESQSVSDVQSLRQQFQLPRAQHLNAGSDDELQSLALAKVAQEQGMLSARLSHCINPEALSFSLDKRCGLDRQVFDNLDKHCVAKFNPNTAPELPKNIDIVDILARQQDYLAELVA